jgi:predicted metalloprotease with PDZ domain
MRNTGKILILSLAVLIAVPLLAGGKHKCEATTQECLDKMAAKYKNHGWVGIEGDKKDGGHFVIKKVISDSPAEAAGLRKGDVLVAMNGVGFADENKDKLKKIKSSLAPGKTLEYTVKRNGKKKVVAVTLGEVPDEVLAQWVGKHMLEHSTVKVASSK